MWHNTYCGTCGKKTISKPRIQVYDKKWLLYIALLLFYWNSVCINQQKHGCWPCFLRDLMNKVRVLGPGLEIENWVTVNNMHKKTAHNNSSLSGEEHSPLSIVPYCHCVCVYRAEATGNRGHQLASARSAHATRLPHNELVELLLGARSIPRVWPPAITYIQCRRHLCIKRPATLSGFAATAG